MMDWREDAISAWSQHFCISLLYTNFAKCEIRIKDYVGRVPFSGSTKPSEPLWLLLLSRQTASSALSVQKVKLFSFLTWITSLKIRLERGDISEIYM